MLLGFLSTTSYMQIGRCKSRLFMKERTHGVHGKVLLNTSISGVAFEWLCCVKILAPKAYIERTRLCVPCMCMCVQSSSPSVSQSAALYVYIYIYIYTYIRWGVYCQVPFGKACLLECALSLGSIAQQYMCACVHVELG